ncbi:uncharacterized protein LOC132702602 [Cylas formicarius]|uniref:uncharacterized protein LOC132702602 n=1 Tax=Cylas formicarius TaxID=197179 RepID=UPI00295878DA|nr:uncharacterized protein LOC132702602 [Cylas formicarius]
MAKIFAEDVPFLMKIRISETKTYEQLAKIQQFPCSLSKNCNKLLEWGRVLDHEEVCEFVNVMEVQKVAQHFSQNHKIFNSGSFELLLPDTSTIYLSEFDNNSFVVGIFIDNDSVSIKVFGLCDKLASFFVVLEFNNISIDLGESEMIKYFPDKDFARGDSVSVPDFEWKKESLADIFKNDQLKYLKIHFDICYINKSNGRGLMKDLLLSCLECPVCFKLMKLDKIINCNKGHSICSSCYNNLPSCGYNKVCPTCGNGFNSQNRNYPLEALRREILEIRPQILRET